jgi:hypothetical protein
MILAVVAFAVRATVEAMWLATKLGFFSIVQKEPPDDGDAAVYHIRARVREDLENLLRLTDLQREILTWPSADYRFRIMASQQEVFEIMSALAESIDYDNFKGVIAATPDQRDRLDAYHKVWSTLAHHLARPAP